jgi:DnaK suppressor protein
MNEYQTEYFRQKLLKWRSELWQESGETLAHLQEGPSQDADIVDRAQAETDRSL